MPCNNSQLKEELIQRILLQNPNYSKEMIEKAVTTCCSQKSPDMEACVSERTRQLYLMGYKREE